MEGVFNRFDLKVGESKKQGIAELSAYNFSNEKDPIYNLRHAIHGNTRMIMADGNYIRLTINKRLFMSDTRMEKTSNRRFIKNAKGKVFIAGLGIGLIIHNLEDKVKKGVVTSITVVEKSQDVIDLVKPYFKDFPINYVCADIMNYTPNKKDKYDTIYFDIWEDISTDNLKDIDLLHDRYHSFLLKKGVMSSWMHDLLLETKEQEEAEANGYWY